jgi:anthranilate/para-aminobenzoate synthase component I
MKANTIYHLCFAGKLPFSGAPPDDRDLPDMHLALYNDVLVFDHATKLAYVISWVHLDEHADVDAAYQVGCADRRWEQPWQMPLV